MSIWKPRAVGQPDPKSERKTTPTYPAGYTETSPADTETELEGRLRRAVDTLRGQVQQMEHEFVSLRAEVEARRITGPTLGAEQRLRETVLRYEERLEVCRREHADADELDRLKTGLVEESTARWGRAQGQPW